MATYLLTWNPDNYDWPDLDDVIRQVQERGGAETWWSSGSSRNIEPGSRFFLMRLGREPRGLIGAGTTVRAPATVPHWDEARRARGETSLNVDIRFDALSRLPVIRRVELNHKELADQQWDPQASGISIRPEIADRLERIWQDRVQSASPTAYHVPPPLLRLWTQRWEDLTADRERLEQFHARDDQRRVVMPQIQALLQQFRAGELELLDFREVFDRKTRNEWDVFGLKGNSGAMFLNKIVKYIPDQAAAAASLRAAMAPPRDDAEASVRLNELLQFLSAVIARGEASSMELQPNRAPFLISACWHVQDPQRWPVLYDTARKAYAMDGLFTAGPVDGDGYVEFTLLTRALAAAFGGDLWDVEHTCVHLVEGRSEPAPVVDLTGETGESSTPRVWLLAPGPGASKWPEFQQHKIAAIGWPSLGDLTAYASREDIEAALQAGRDDDAVPRHDALACWEFAHVMKPGDVIFAKKGRTHIIGYGIVRSAYRYEPSHGGYRHVRDVDWRMSGEWVAREKPLVTKTLTEITSYTGLVSKIRAALGLDDDSGPTNGGETTKRVHAPYGMGEACQDLFLGPDWLERAIQLLRYKRNLVLQGPPGVGKTFVAQRLAYLLVGEKNPDLVARVQFHASYSYEDFVQGYRPARGGFERADGPFFELCDQAHQDPTSPHVFLIDEINRGNLSKIFGELLMLLEGDKRGPEWAVRLTYARPDDETFFVPPNVYVIGTMNTADRSLAMVDYALRRRFAFVDVPPCLETAAFDQHLARLGASEELRRIVRDRVQHLNAEIAVDKSLGAGFQIGHSYFCHVPPGTQADMAWFRRIVDTEIEPLLREYWYDAPERAEDAAAALRGD